MAFHESKPVMERLAEMEANLMAHQSEVANRGKEDYDQLIRISNYNKSIVIQSNMDMIDRVMRIKVKQDSVQTQLVKMEDRIMNTMSVQIGLMEARMALNTRQASVSKLRSDMLDEFLTMKVKLKKMLTMIYKIEVKESKRQRAKPQEEVVPRKKNVGKRTRNSKNASSKNKPSLSTSKVTKIDGGRNLASVKRRLENENENNTPSFDSDFLELMRDANIVPDEQGSDVPAKKIKIEDPDNTSKIEGLPNNASNLDVMLHNFGVTGVVSESGVAETVAVKSEQETIEPFVDVKTEDVVTLFPPICVVKAEADDVYEDFSNNNTNDISVNDKVAYFDPKKKVRNLPQVCPQISSKLSPVSHLKGRNGIPVNRMLPPKLNLDGKLNPESSSSSAMTQTSCNRTPGDDKIINIVYSCGFCGEDSFSKKALEEHIVAHHRDYIM